MEAKCFVLMESWWKVGGKLVEETGGPDHDFAVVLEIVWSAICG